MEEALTNQRQVATNIFNRLVRHGFEQQTRHLVKHLRKKRASLTNHDPCPPSPDPIPEVVRINTPRPAETRLARKTISKPKNVSIIPFPTRQDSLSDYHTPPTYPLGSRHNPIVVEDQSPSPGLSRAKESRRLGNRKLKAP